MRLLVFLLLTGIMLIGCETDGLLWMPPSNRADALFRIIDRERAGFIDRRGRIIIPPTLEVESNWGQAFYDGLLSLGVAEGPFLNTRGQKILANGFYRLWAFSEGLAAAISTEKSQWGFVDRSGRFVISPRFPTYPEGLVSSFSEGLAAVEVAGKLGYIDRSGTFVIARQFVAGTPFENGVARVVADGPCTYANYEHFDPCLRMPTMAPRTGDAKQRVGPTLPGCKWRFIDSTGRLIIDQEFEAALGFHEGLSAVKVGKLWGFIDRRGALVIPPAFHVVRSFSGGLALVENDKVSGYIDKTGALRIPAEVHKAQPFSEGLAAVGHPDEGYIFIDPQGRQAIPERFALASRFFHGLAHVKIGPASDDHHRGTFAYIDETGKHVYTYRR